MTVNALYDRVRELVKVTGFSAVQLGSPVAGFQTYASVMTVNQTCWYCIVDQTTFQWEVGIGTFTVGDILQRAATPLASSNGGARVAFGGNLCEVFQDPPADFYGISNLAPGLISFNGEGMETVDLSSRLVFAGGTLGLSSIASHTILGNPTGSSSEPSPLVLGANLSISGITLNATGGVSAPGTGLVGSDGSALYDVALDPNMSLSAGTLTLSGMAAQSVPLGIVWGDGSNVQAATLLSPLGDDGSGNISINFADASTPGIVFPSTGLSVNHTTGALTNTGIVRAVQGTISVGGTLTISTGLTLNAGGTLTSGGGGTITLSGDITGASATGTISTTLAKIGGTYALHIDSTNEPSGVVGWLNSATNLWQFDTLPQLGSSSNTAGNRQGGFYLHDSSNGAPNTSHQVLLAGPFGTMSASYTIQLPLAKGAANSTLFYDGIDTLTFQTPGVARALLNQGTVAAAGSTSITIDMSLGSYFVNTMTANATLLNPTNMGAGSTAQIVINAGTSGTLTLAYGSAYLFNAPYSNASPPAIGAGDNVLTISSKDGTHALSLLQPGTWA